MPTPPKTFQVISNEKKSHKTKKELKQRQSAEASLATGRALKERPEVKNNTVAHNEFKRINNILKSINKNDAIYEGVINRYCLMVSECKELEDNVRDLFCHDLHELEDNKDRLISMEEMSLREYFSMKLSMQKTIIDLDKQVQSKRKMLLDIEKENIMTMAAALRTIPKKEEKKSNGLREALIDG